MRRILTVLAICLLPILGFLAYSPDVPALPALGDGSRQAMNVSGFTNAMEELDTAGIEWVSFGIPWYEVEETRDSYDFSGVKSKAQDMDNAGVKILVQFVRSNHWVAVNTDCWYEETNDTASDDETGFYDLGNPSGTRCPPDDSELDEYAEIINMLLDSVPEIDALSVENEPNDSVFFYETDFRTGTGDPVGDGADDATLLEMYNVADSVIDTNHPNVLSVGPEWAACSRTSIFDFLDSLSNEYGRSLDVIATHCYGKPALGAFPSIENYTEEFANSAASRGYSQPFWLTEYGQSNDPLTADTIKQYLQLSVYGDPDFEEFFYFHWTNPDSNEIRNMDREIVQLDRSTSPETVSGVKEIPYCWLVSNAGNEGQEDRCPDVYEIKGHDMFAQEVPPETECVFQSNQDGGSTPYSWEWRVDGNIESTSEWLTYFTPSSGSFVIEVTVIDDNGAQDTYEETMTVSSTADCTV